MAVTNYYTANGKIRGESTNGVRTTYGTDALGSVTGTYDEDGNAQNTYLWAPYGTLIKKTGTATDPKFGWNGASGYRNTGRSYSGFFVRRRVFDLLTAQWTTVDPLWPNQPSFVYASAEPTGHLDGSGQTVQLLQMQTKEALYYGILGIFELPYLCTLPNPSSNDYINLYVSTVSGSGGTSVDMGFSFAVSHGNPPKACRTTAPCWGQIIKSGGSNSEPAFPLNIPGGSSIAYQITVGQSSVTFWTPYHTFTANSSGGPSNFRISVGTEYSGNAISLSKATVAADFFLTKTGSYMTVYPGFFKPILQGAQLSSAGYWPLMAYYGSPLDYCGPYTKVREG